MFEQNISSIEKLVNSLGITIIGMSVVFLVLILLSFTLDLLRIYAREGEEKSYKSEEVISSTRDNKQKEEDCSELIAIIAAAISVSSDRDVEPRMIKKIKRISQKGSVWNQMGLQEQMRQPYLRK